MCNQTLEWRQPHIVLLLKSNSVHFYSLSLLSYPHLVLLVSSICCHFASHEHWRRVWRCHQCQILPFSLYPTSYIKPCGTVSISYTFSAKSKLWDWNLGNPIKYRMPSHPRCSTDILPELPCPIGRWKSNDSSAVWTCWAWGQPKHISLRSLFLVSTIYFSWAQSPMVSFGRMPRGADSQLWKMGLVCKSVDWVAQKKWVKRESLTVFISCLLSGWSGTSGTQGRKSKNVPDCDLLGQMG